MPETYDHVGLDDQILLTTEERARALRAIGSFEEMVERRKARIFEEGLDPSVWMPAANWDLERQHSLYNRVIPLLSNNLDLLRLIGSHFTGYRLATLGGALEEHSFDRLGRALSDYMAANRDEAAVSHYLSQVRNLPDWIRIAPPPRFGEVGWLIDGVIVNQDTAGYAERIAVMHRSGLLDHLRQQDRCRVLEIGGGYGALAYYLKQAIPQLEYYIVDIPESLIFSSAYLSVLGDHSFKFIPNYEFLELSYSGISFDLVINTLSMSEMTEQQVSVYCTGIRRLIRNTGKFFEQNQNNRHAGFIDSQEVIARFFAKSTSLGGPNIVPYLQHGFANIWEQQAVFPLDVDTDNEGATDSHRQVPDAGALNTAAPPSASRTTEPPYSAGTDPDVPPWTSDAVFAGDVGQA